MKTQPSNQNNNSTRRGTLLPAIAFSLLVVAAASALVMNKLWIDAAEIELQNVAEATALAAAGDYLGDELLKPGFDADAAVEQAKQRAAQVAASNLVGGQPVSLTITGDDTDIVFGRRVDNGIDPETVFLLTNKNPSVVEVRASRSRDLGNPINLFYPGVTKRAYADATMIVEVTFDNHIDHFVAAPARPIPALPLAILANDPLGKRTDTWANMIEAAHGADDYAYNEVTHEVVKQSDGIPEITLRSVPLKSDPLKGNVQLLDFNNELNDQKIIQQINNGLTQLDMKPWNNRLQAQEEMQITGLGNITTPIQFAMESQIGQQRLCLLYNQATAIDVPGWTSLSCEGVVAIRILKVIPESGESATVIVQPTVLTTKSAVLTQFFNEMADYPNLPPNLARMMIEPKTNESNKYVYKIYVSR
ncbi:hypothetical protein [Rubinisphaera italica]|uniref:Uncharacterized protein n=1 Tax=Rubinisphaera italica TaxID=2527969 RepID=A0A5C5XA18_9PLAN|nr:hypothetical protein [Rubinisphaera italica]TWT59549.1 hypothetical protein Pan54_02560 [Rubinisphaera italica]